MLPLMRFGSGIGILPNRSPIRYGLLVGSFGIVDELGGAGGGTGKAFGLDCVGVGVTGAGPVVTVDMVLTGVDVLEAVLV